MITGSKGLPALRETAYAAIDSGAEASRQSFLTPGAGQALVYLQKAQEAAAFLVKYPTALVAPAGTDTVNWPFMSAEVGILGATMFAVATLIHSRAAAWVAIAAAIERKRMAAKLAVAAAPSAASIASAQAVVWPAVQDQSSTS